MKEEIIADLGSNYRASDSTVLEKILERVITQALIISNRKTSARLELEIQEAVKTIYLQRGTEDVENLSESGRSGTFKKAMQQLRTDIISNGKRRIM